MTLNVDKLPRSWTNCIEFVPILSWQGCFQKGGYDRKKENGPKRKCSLSQDGLLNFFLWLTKFFPLSRSTRPHFRFQKGWVYGRTLLVFHFQRLGVSFFFVPKILDKSSINPTPLQLFFRKISNTFVIPLPWSYPSSPKWWNHQVAVVDESVDVSSTTEVSFLMDVWVDVNIELFTERGRSFVETVTVSIPGNILILYLGDII